MMIRKTTIPYLFFFLCILLFACKPANAEKQEPSKAPAENKSAYPFLSNEEITNLYTMTDKADFIFYDLPISVNQDDATSAKNSVLYISPAPAQLNSSCKALGRLSWMSNGTIVREADFYSDSLCHYFIFMSNNKPVAANAMSEAGQHFFKNIITQVQQRQQ